MNSTNFLNRIIIFFTVTIVVICGCQITQAEAPQRRGKELIVDGDMEKEGGWKGVSGGKGNTPLMRQALDDKHSGKASKRIVLNRKGNKWPEIISSSFTTETGKTYEVRFWYKIIEGSFYTGARSGTDNDYQPIKPGMSFLAQDGAPKNPTWRKYVGTYTEKKGGKNAQLQFICRASNYATAPKRTEFYLDDVSVKELDVSIKAVLKEWRKLLPGRKYVCWKKSPWDNVKPNQFPRADFEECKGLSVAMGQNEYESASFVVTNLSDSEMKIAVSVKAPTIPVVLRQAMCVTDMDGAKVNDALVLLVEPIIIPAGESQEIWLTVHSKGHKAGDYKAPITVALKDSEITIPLDVKVYPVMLPEDKPLYTCYWDEIVPEWHGQELTTAYMKDMKEHYVNVAFGHPWPTRMKYDSKGKIKIDHTDLDNSLDAYEKLNPRMMVLWLCAPTYMEKQKGYLSDVWKGQFRIWLQALVKHLKQRGWGYDRFAICPFDESLGPKVLKLVKLINEIDPKILIHINSTGEGVSTKEDIRNIAPYVDIWAPFLYDYLNVPPYDRSFEEKILAADIIRKNVKDEYYWTYTNTLSAGRPKSVSPYEEYRLPVWKAWELGMRGFGYWVYTHGTNWQGHKAKRKSPGWAVVYLANAKDAPAGITKKELVIPSKRWEATREGVEDYVCLYMLRDAIAQAEKLGVDKKTLAASKAILNETPKKVLKNKKNHTLADGAKENVLKAIITLPAK